MTSRSVLVIGAGIAGLTAATHLARGGLRVTVVEKHAGPGGRCGRFVRDGHRFDIGPTLFVMPRLYEAEFAALGASARDRLDLRPVDPTYRLVFDDGSQLSLTADRTSMREQLEAIEPGSFGGFDRYVREGGRHYGLIVDRYVERPFRGLRDLLGVDTVRLFLVPLDVGRPQAGFRFEARWLDLPMVQNEQSLREFLRQVPASLLIKYRDQASITERIRRLLRSHLQREMLSLDEVSRRLIEATLAECGSKRKAAEMLGISLKTLYNRLAAYKANEPAPEEDEEASKPATDEHHRRAA